MKGLNPFLNKSGIIRNCSELLPSQAYLSPAELRRVRRGPRRPRREPRSLALVVAEEAEIIICELIFRLLALLATLASFPASKLASLSTAGMLITVLLSLDGTPLSVPAHNDTMNTLHYIVNIISSTRKVIYGIWMDCGLAPMYKQYSRGMGSSWYGNNGLIYRVSLKSVKALVGTFNKEKRLL